MAEPSLKKDKPMHNYAVYSNMGIEMAVLITVGVFGGIKLDGWLKTSPLFTILLSLSGVAIAIYVMIKTLTPKNKPNEPKDTN